MILCFACSMITAIPLQLISPSYEQCLEDARSMRTTFERQRYLRAVVLTASTLATLSVLYNYLFGSEASPVTVAVPVKKYNWFSWETIENVGKWLARASAQAICVQWVTRNLLTNNADPKIYITKYIHYYHKTHCAEIERLLQIRAADDYVCQSTDEVDLLIQCHLQALLDKIEQLMAYMLYYAPEYASPHTEMLVERYAHELLKKVAIIAEQSNSISRENFDEAVLSCKQQCADILISAMRYALASLPSDE